MSARPTPDDTLQEIFRSFASFPRFADGRIDYTHAREAAVVDVFASVGGRLLLVKRSERVLHYKGVWHVVAGYLDDPAETVAQAARKELREEIGVHGSAVRRVEVSGPVRRDGRDGYVWHVFAVFAELAPDVVITLDEEASAYAFVDPVRLTEDRDHELVPGVHEVFTTVARFFKDSS